MADKSSKIALGLMSGTSLDGVDAAFLETDGDKIIRFGPSLTLPMPANNPMGETIRAALAWQFKGSPPHIFTKAEDFIDSLHIKAVRILCDQYPDWAHRLSVIGYHGQTVLHVPPTVSSKRTRTGRTLQLGRGQRLATATGVPVVFDFRSADVAAGGQGAPLAPIYHKALSEYSALVGDIAVLNLGGVGNVTLIADGDIWASDTGPANGPLDSWMLMMSGQAIDRNGAAALAGRVDFGRIEPWLKAPFFERSVPRSADRYDFDVLEEMQDMSLSDGAATLVGFCVLSVVKTLAAFPKSPTRLIVCGGGRHNAAIMWMLQAQMGIEVLSAEDVSWNSDAIEAQAFAYLAARHMRKLPISLPSTTGVSHPMTTGRLVNPS